MVGCGSLVCWTHKQMGDGKLAPNTGGWEIETVATHLLVLLTGRRLRHLSDCMLQHNRSTSVVIS